MEYISGIRLKNFQSFDKVGALVLDPSNFNIFVGPNNVGKSKLIRVFERLRTGSKGVLLDANPSTFGIVIYEKLGKEIAIRADSDWNFRQNVMKGIDSEIFIDHMSNGFKEYALGPSKDAPQAAFTGFVEYPDSERLSEEEVLETYKFLKKQNIQFPSYPIPPKNYFYIAAERDVLPEITDKSAVTVSPNGTGTTALIRKYLLDANFDTDFVRLHMLKELNEILHPNYQFIDIRCQEISNSSWEVFLRTDKYGDIALSQSGSGLKTILQLLANTQLVLKSGNACIEEGLFLFEELENSLHPRMQRNVYKYIKNKFVNKAICVMSTHSSVAIDFFQAKDDVSMYEVHQVDGITRCRKIEAFNDKVGVLDSLGVRASDALQSNFIIWVEGPTDRIYLKKIFKLLGYEDLVEGSDFSILFYGGRMLSHLTLSEEDANHQFIRLLKINPKCAVIIDSDRTKKRGRLNDTKTRIRFEANKNSKMCWVTQGREIENYFSSFFWASKFKVPVDSVSEYSKVYDYLYSQEKRIGQRKLSSKMELANYVDTSAERTDICLDVERKVKELVREIKLANN